MTPRATRRAWHEQIIEIADRREPKVLMHAGRQCRSGGNVHIFSPRWIRPLCRGPARGCWRKPSTASERSTPLLLSSFRQYLCHTTGRAKNQTLKRAQAERRVWRKDSRRRVEEARSLGFGPAQPVRNVRDFGVLLYVASYRGI